MRRDLAATCHQRRCAGQEHVSQPEGAAYTVVACFTTEERARAYMQAFSGHYTQYNDLEEYELDPCTEQIAAGLCAYEVRIRYDGRVDIVRRTDCTPDDDAYRWSASRDRCYFHIMARDDAHAMKIANELRISY